MIDQQPEFKVLSKCLKVCSGTNLVNLIFDQYQVLCCWLWRRKPFPGQPGVIPEVASEAVLAEQADVGFASSSFFWGYMWLGSIDVGFLPER